MLAVSAEAKTSAGAPCWICATRSEEPPKLNLTFTPSWSASNCLPSSVKVDVSDAAAYTVRVVVPVPDEEPSGPSDPHADTAIASSSAVSTRGTNAS